MQISERIKQRTSEIISNFKANTSSQERLKASIAKSLNASTQNAKDLESAKKNNQIQDPHYQSATFLNNINKTINESLASADSSTLDSINKNLTDIRKLISDYTKNAIDKQDTSISYTDPTSPKKVSEGTGKGDKQEEKKSGGIWDFLKNLFGGLLTLFGIPLLFKIGKTLFKIGKAVYDLGKGAVKAVIKAVEFVKKYGTKAIEILTQPVKWFTETIWPSAKNLITGWLQKIPGIGKLFSSAEGVAETAKAASQGTKAARSASIGARFTSWLGDKAKAIKGKIADKVLKSFPWLQDMFETFKNIASKAIDKVKIVFNKLYRLATMAKNGIQATGKFAGPIGKILAKIVKKGAARLVAFIASLAAGPVGWIVTFLLTAWLVWDYATYIWSNRKKHNWYSPELHLAAAINALIGIDILNNTEDAEVWESIEPLTPQEANKLTNNLDRKTLKTASAEQRENIRNQLETEYLGYTKKFNHLASHNITYKDSDGNALSDEDSKKIYNLELERADLMGEKALLQAQYADRLGNKNFYNGEVEISSDPKKFKELVNYFYDELKEGTFWRDIITRNTTDPNVELQKHFLQYKKYMESGDIVNAAKEMAKVEIFKAIANMQAQGLDFKTIEKAILDSDRYASLTEKINSISVRLNENQAELANYGDYSVLSETKNSNTSLKVPSGLGTSRAVAAANYAWQHSKERGEKGGQCAKYVNDAIVFGGGYKGYGRGNGYQVGDSLRDIGWQPTGAPYKVGDVAVFNKSSATNPQYGHTAILSKNGWVSDIKQNEMSPYKDKVGSYAEAVVYRDPGTTGKSLMPSTPITNSYVAGNFSSDSSKTIISQPTIVQQPPSEPVDNSPVDITEYWALLP